MRLGTAGWRRSLGRAACLAKYSATGLIRHGLVNRPWPSAWRPQPMKSSYDVVIVGGGCTGSPPASTTT